MASTNQSPFYQRAEEDFLKATTDEERIECLDIMIKECPKHKGAENMLANLKTRMKKLKKGLAKQKKTGKSTQEGIKKDDMQAILVGPPNTGKSTIFKTLTKQEVKISPHPFTTYEAQPGTTKFEDAQIQLIDMPPFPNEDRGLTNSTDTLLVVIDNLDQISECEERLKRSISKKILIFNKIDLLSEQEKRKTKETLKSKHKKWDFIFFSDKATKVEIGKLKEKIFNTFPIIRVYTKEPRKDATKDPMILKKESTVEDAAEKILKGMSKKIKQVRIWGPSSKFSGQVVGLEHQLKDKDTIELHTK